MYRKERKAEVHKGIGLNQSGGPSCNCDDIGNSLKILFTNPMYVLIVLAGSIDLGAVTAFAAFLPKIIQFQFEQSSSSSAIIAGKVLTDVCLLYFC